eukprot:522758_1
MEESCNRKQNKSKRYNHMLSAETNPNPYSGTPPLNEQFDIQPIPNTMYSAYDCSDGPSARTRSKTSNVNTLHENAQPVQAIQCASDIDMDMSEYNHNVDDTL